MQTLLTLGPLLAGTTALLALIVSLTRGARLGHRERVLRESMTVLEANSPHRRTVSELHLRTVAEIVARQSSGKWRFCWPWLVLLFVVANTALIGYETTRYFERGGTYDYGRMVAEIGGGDPTVLVFPIFLVTFLPTVVLAYRHSIFDRATIALDFYSRGILREPVGVLSALEDPPEEPDRSEKRWRGIQATAHQLKVDSAAVVKSVAPGVTAASAGLVLGLGIGLRQFPLEQRANVLSAMGAMPALVIFLGALSMAATFWAVTVWRLAFLKRFPSQPHPHKPPEHLGSIGYI